MKNNNTKIDELSNINATLLGIYLALSFGILRMAMAKYHNAPVTALFFNFELNIIKYLSVVKIKF